MSIALFFASCSFSAHLRVASLRRCNPPFTVSDPETEGAWTQLPKRSFEETGEQAGKDFEKFVSADVRILLEKGFKVPPKETSVVEPTLTFLAITLFETSERLKRIDRVLNETATTLRAHADQLKARQVRTASLVARLVTCVTAPLSVAARAFWVRTINGGMVLIPVLILGNLSVYLAIYSTIYPGSSSLLCRGQTGR